MSNKSILQSMAATAGMMALTGLTCVAITAGSYSSDLEIKDQQISDLERALDVMEEANTSLKTDNETKQIIIDGLEYELEQAK